LSDFRGKKVVLYFYPRDMTPGCTQQACDLSENYERYLSKNIIVLGISADEVKKHSKFAQKYNLPFSILSDEDHTICEQYGVWQEKKLYGKTFFGIVRTTFLIDEEGVIQEKWEKVKVKNHIDDISKKLF
ncbi:MAG: thioredoxin-dependent thiol peroxidase, partial [Bacilli bacterium]